MKKKIAVFTISSEVGKFYKQQLEYFFEDLVEIFLYSMEENNFANIISSADLYVVATTSSDTFEYVMSFIPENKSFVILYVTFKKDCLKMISKIKKGTKALLVNLSVNMAIETIADLNRFGITNIEFFPAYPGMELIPEVDLAITPAESRYVPEKIKKVIDIGNRVLSAKSISEIALKLGFNQLLDSAKFKNYMDSLAEYDYSISTLASRNFNMENKFDILLEAMDVGIIGVESDNKIFAFNRAAEEILGVKKNHMIGTSVDKLLPFTKKYAGGNKFEGEDTKLIKVKGIYVSATVTPIIRQSAYMGNFITIQRFYDEENKQHKLRAQMLEGGHISKYTFDDIIGESECMKKTKSIAMKMAKTDSSILLTGESGTGKELFAHSIHNSSSRNRMAFVAINCAALPDTLLESELFGYGEGAFTGAKKGGKLGLFEYAHRGTLFLDEIEAMSPNLQVKLLRVLQEKEVMRVGENKIIHIDARIIAASNENIRSMVENGSFRKDLYYRLNTLPIDIPPLRDRGNDIFLLVEQIKESIGAKFQLTEGAKNAFLNYKWDGNIRELRNMVEYLKFMDLNIIDYSDLPDILKSGLEDGQLSGNHSKKTIKFLGLSDSQIVVLKILKDAENKSVFLGRKSISEEAKKYGILLSEQEVRTLIKKLKDGLFVEVIRGRKGTILTEKGREALDMVN